MATATKKKKRKAGASDWVSDIACRWVGEQERVRISIELMLLMTFHGRDIVDFGHLKYFFTAEPSHCSKVAEYSLDEGRLYSR